MLQLPLYIALTFGITTVLTLFLFRFAIRKTSRQGALFILAGLAGWLMLTGILAWKGFFTDTTVLPPRLAFALVPPMLVIVLLCVTRKGRQFLDSLSLVRLTWLNTVRVPVELVLYWLFLYRGVPQLMTFEGRNFDILVGASAPFIAYFGFQRRLIGRKVILLWNVLSLGILCNIVFHGILSAPSSFQQFAFDQPNIALFYFPFVWLPAFIVPVALLTHLASIRQLTRQTPQ